MPRPLVIINVVGLTHEMLGPNTPNISRVAADGFAIPMGTVLPAVTCSAQATLLTGTLPREHGIVANGWYWRDLSEVLFWRQSNQLVRGERLYDAARKARSELFGRETVLVVQYVRRRELVGNASPELSR